jgi:hypothetical protein
MIGDECASLRPPAQATTHPKPTAHDHSTSDRIAVFACSRQRGSEAARQRGRSHVLRLALL